MQVDLIARPQFLGVPPELQPFPRSKISDHEQDRGTSAERLCECAGRTCYDSYGRGRASDEYHANILNVGHGSVLEHATFSFFITGVSRGLTHELVRHRAGVAISQRSTRYVDESESDWCYHPLFQMLDDEKLEIVGSVTDACREVYDNVVTSLQQKLSANGVNKFTARKQARGAARGMLGNALGTELVWSANVRALRHFIEMRASPHADAEIRELAIEILAIMQKEAPAFFKDYAIEASPDGMGVCATTSNRKV